MARYRVGVIGAGRKGTQHARAYDLNPLSEIVAVADTDEANRQLFCKRFGVPGYADYDDMLAREDIDIAAPILPVRPNAEVVIGCAEAGVRAILCEKPMATTLADADRMVAACSSRGIALAAGDLDRNLPQYATFLELLATGEYGEVRSITFRGGSGHELSGGGCQQLSLMRMFAGDADVAWVIGWVDGDPASDHDQGGAGCFRFANGIEAFWHREADARGAGFDVACTRGLLRNCDGVLSLWKAGADVERPGWGDLKEVMGVFPEGTVYGRRSGEYDDQGWRWPGDRNIASVQAIINALEGHGESGGSGVNGARVLEMAIAMRESHRRGHQLVKLPLENRSLQLIPHASRMDNKKPQMEPEVYAQQMAHHRGTTL